VGDANGVVLLRPGGAVRDAGAHVGGPGLEMPTVVAVRAVDAFGHAGSMAYLRSRPGITPVPVSRVAEADVVLVVADRLTDDVVDWMRRCAEARGNRVARFVLVSDCVGVSALMRAVSCGPVSVIPRRGSDYEQVVRAIFQIRRERAGLPAAGLRVVSGGESEANDRGALVSRPDPAGVLETRERDVLRLVADGLDTVKIAQRLNYSERTIKSIIHVVLSRLELKNRSHAVAFAIRNGLLLKRRPFIAKR
jgi:DNA-binding NarL/FixJ family response regulator